MSARSVCFSTAFAGTLLLSACSSDKKSPPPPPPAVFTTFQAAAVVIGQPDFTSAVNAYGSPSASSLSSPFGDPVLLGGRFYLPDYGANRILGFDAIPAANGVPADFVLGQTDLTKYGSGTGAADLHWPETVASAGSSLIVDDYGNDRLLVWNSAPTATAPANVVVGWDDFATPATGCAADRLSQPENIFVEGKLLVADSNNNRVLVFNSVPTVSGASADLVLGQQTMTTCTHNDANGDGINDGAPSASTMDYPTGLWTDGTRLVVGDTDNNRVLIWNTFPTRNGQPADLVLGQGSFGTRIWNDDDQSGIADAFPTARTLYGPNYLDSDGTQLFVGDSANSRVLVWTTFPTASFEPADVVLGQGSFSANTANDDDQDGFIDATPSARTFRNVSGVKLIGRQLLVADVNNHRYLIFNGQ